jgi:predicted nucleotidyltransferase
MLDRARAYVVKEGLSLPAVTVEDIIGLKVQAIANEPSRRTQDMADIEWLVSHYRSSLNMALLNEYFALFSLQDELSQILLRAAHVK